jgi:GGDEF domain-containing protein
LISLGKFLRGQDEREDAPYIRALSLLVQGMELHTPDYNKEDYEHFRDGLARVQQKLSPEIPIPELLVLVGGAIGTLEEYNQRTAGRLRSQFQEMRSIIAAFGGAVATMVSASDASLARLGQIQSQLSAAEKIDDLRVLKTHLCDCLNGMATEVEEHRKNSASGMARLAEGAQEFEISVGRTHGPVASDPVTGLPARAGAEAALFKVAGSGVEAVAVVFAVKRLKQLNSRFGYEVGNGLLAGLSTYLGSGANPEEGLYRWSGPALLALISRNEPLDRIRQEIGRLVAGMPQHEITIGARMVMVPVSVGWAVFPVTRPVDRLVRQLETFVESQSSEDSYVTR